MKTKKFALLRTLWMYAAFLLTVLPSVVLLRYSINYSGLVKQGASYGWMLVAYEIPIAVLALLCLFSTVYLFLLYNMRYKAGALAVMETSFQRKRSFVLASPEWMTEVCTFFVMWLIVSVYLLLRIAGKDTPMEEVWWTIALVALIPPIVFGVLLLAHRAAFDGYRAAEKKKKPNRFGKVAFSKRYPRVTFWLLFLRNLLIYAAAGIALPHMISMLVSIGALFRLVPLPVYICIAAIALLAFALTYLRAILKRHSMLKKLKRVCAENGYVLSDVRSFYRSLFRSDNACHFRVQKGRMCFDCKLISGRKRSATIAFSPNGTGSYVRSFALTGGGRTAIHIVRLPRAELFRIVTPFSYEFASEHKKILIVNPVPRKIVLQIEGTERQLYGGEQIGEYTFYNASGFFSALSRDCVGK
ncbi:MAG: hypothetical protein J6B77_01275 [Clostridia bacterium]|nr:hypothetical protein [Clostridia bacterium]